MSEKIKLRNEKPDPRAATVSKAEASLSPEAEHIPLFRELDQKSQEFVLEIKGISDCSEKEFLERYPAAAVKLEPVKRILAKHPQDTRNPLVKWWRERVFYSTESFEREQLHDWDESFATMWQLVELALLELKDFKELGRGMHSPRTSYLARQIAASLYLPLKQSPDYPLYTKIVPDAFKFHTSLDKPLVLEDVGDLLTRIHTVLSSLHQFRHEFAPGVVAIKDFWRYAVLHGAKIGYRSFFKLASPLSFRFLKKLSDLNLQ